MLSQMWRDWLDALEQNGAQIPLSEKVSLAKRYQKVRSSDQSGRTRRLIDELDRLGDSQPPTKLLDRLQEILLKLGCWPELAVKGARPTSLKPFGEYANQLNTATEENQPGVLRILLDWDGSGKESRWLLRSSTTGVGLPTGFHAGQVTGWARAVRNATPECLAAWLEAGADPNAVDLAGRPVLAYASKSDSLALLLRHGADPLHPSLSVETRRANLDALWQGWQTPLCRHVEAPEKEKEGAICEGYLRSSLSKWSDEDLRQAGGGVLLAAYLGVRMGGRSKASAKLAPLAQELVRASFVEDHQEVTVGDRSWSFAGLLALEWLLTKPSWQDNPRLRKIPRGRESANAVPEKTLAVLVNLSEEPFAAMASLSKVGPFAVARALAVALEEASARGGLNTESLLFLRTWEVLNLASRMGPDWVAGMAPAVDAWFKTLRYQWERSVPAPASFRVNAVLDILSWVMKNSTHLPASSQANWLVQGLSAYQPSDKTFPETSEAKDALVAIFRQDVMLLGDPLIREGLEMAYKNHGGLEKAIRSISAEAVLEKGLPTVTASPSKPRF